MPSPGKVTKCLSISWTACLAGALAGAGGVAAAPFCDTVEGLIGQAPADFPDWESSGPPPMQGAEECAVTQALSGQRSYYCAWSFDYRAATASDAFEEKNARLQHCLGDRASMRGDRPVNHPDFYDLRLYQLDGVTVALSLKDKAALRKTYVFLRVERRLPE